MDYHEYPKHLNHADGTFTVVNNSDEEDAYRVKHAPKVVDAAPASVEVKAEEKPKKKKG